MSKLTRQSLCVAFAMLVTTSVMASSGGHKEEYDEINKAVAAGEIMSVEKVVEQMNAAYPGNLIKVELDKEFHKGSSVWTYEVKVVHPDGTATKLNLDAKTGQVLK